MWKLLTTHTHIYVYTNIFSAMELNVFGVLFIMKLIMWGASHLLKWLLNNEICMAGVRLHKPNIHCTCFFHDNKHNKSSFPACQHKTQNPKWKCINRMEITRTHKKSGKKGCEQWIQNSWWLFSFYFPSRRNSHTLFSFVHFNHFVCVLCAQFHRLTLPNIIRFLHMNYIHRVFIIHITKMVLCCVYCYHWKEISF